MEIEWNGSQISWKMVIIIVSFFLMIFGGIAVRYNHQNKVIDLKHNCLTSSIEPEVCEKLSHNNIK